MPYVAFIKGVEEWWDIDQKNFFLGNLSDLGIILEVLSLNTFTFLNNFLKKISNIKLKELLPSNKRKNLKKYLEDIKKI